MYGAFRVWLGAVRVPSLLQCTACSLWASRAHWVRNPQIWVLVLILIHWVTLRARERCV